MAPTPPHSASVDWDKVWNPVGNDLDRSAALTEYHREVVGTGPGADLAAQVYQTVVFYQDREYSTLQAQSIALERKLFKAIEAFVEKAEDWDSAGYATEAHALHHRIESVARDGVAAPAGILWNCQVDDLCLRFESAPHIVKLFREWEKVQERATDKIITDTLRYYGVESEIESARDPVHSLRLVLSMGSATSLHRGETDALAKLIADSEQNLAVRRQQGTDEARAFSAGPGCLRDFLADAGHTARLELAAVDERLLTEMDLAERGRLAEARAALVPQAIAETWPEAAARPQHAEFVAGRVASISVTPAQLDAHREKYLTVDQVVVRIVDAEDLATVFTGPSGSAISALDVTDAQPEDLGAYFGARAIDELPKLTTFRAHNSFAGRVATHVGRAAEVAENLGFEVDAEALLDRVETAIPLNRRIAGSIVDLSVDRQSGLPAQQSLSIHITLLPRPGRGESVRVTIRDGE